MFAWFTFDFSSSKRGLRALPFFFLYASHLQAIGGVVSTGTVSSASTPQIVRRNFTCDGCFSASLYLHGYFACLRHAHGYTPTGVFENGRRTHKSRHTTPSKHWYRVLGVSSSSFSSASVQLHHYQDSDTLIKCILGYSGVSIIHRTLTWTTGSLTCVCDLFAYIYIYIYSKKTWCLTSTETQGVLILWTGRRRWGREEEKAWKEVNMVLHVHRNHKSYSGEGGGGYGGWGRGRL